MPPHAAASFISSLSGHPSERPSDSAFVRGRETEGSVSLLRYAVGTVGSTARGVCAELCGPLDLIAAVELDESPVVQGD